MRYQIEFSMMMVLAALLLGCVESTSPAMLVGYQRTGGLAGLDDRLIVDTTGRTTLTRKGVRTEFILSSDTTNRLRSILDNVRFNDLKREYLPPRSGNDLFEYTITYRGHTIRMMDTAIPESLQPVLELLNQIVANDGTQ